MRTKTSTDPPRDPVDGLLLQWIASEPVQRDAVLDAACREHPEFAEVLRRRAAHLLESGLLGTESVLARPLDRLGPFRLQRMIGGGGMGVVYLARQEHLDRPVAVKLLRPEFQLLERSRERFRREIAAVSRLQHPGIVPVYHCGEDQNVLFLAMEHVDGLTLAELLQALPRRSVERMSGADVLAAMSERGAPQPALRELCRGTWSEVSVRIALRIAAALQHAHERGVVHRDVKPSNVILGHDGRVMLMDFGLAQATGASKLTASGAQAGSLPYMAPEQVRGESADARTDVYGLGVALYELLALLPPYWEEGPEALRRRILEARAVPLRQRNRAVARELEVVCQKAMEPSPARRYASAADFAADLAAVLERRPIAARPAGTVLRCRRWCQRHPTAVVALAAGMALAIGGPLLVNLSLRAQRDEALQQAYSARIVAAAYYLSIHNAIGAKQQLRACAPDLRGFEWQYLDRAADQSVAHLPELVGYFAALHWARDGDVLVHCDEGSGEVTAVRVADGGRIWRRAPDAVRWADVSPDGEVVAVAQGGPVVSRFDVATGTVLPDVTVKELDGVAWLQYLPATGGLAVGSQRGQVSVLEADGGTRWLCHGMPQACRAASPDGRLVVAAHWDERLGAELWDLERGVRLVELAAGHRVWSATFRADGQRFAVGTEQGVILTFDRDGAPVSRMAGHAGRTVNSLRFVGDDRLYSVGNDCTLQTWDPERGALLETACGHEAIVLDLDVHPREHRIATVSPFDGTRIWDRDAAPHRNVLLAGDSGAEGLVWSEDGSLLYAAGQDGRCRILESRTGREVTALDAGRRLSQCAVAGERLFCIGFDEQQALACWDLRAGGAPTRLAVSGYHDVALAVADGGRLVACGDADGTVRLLDAEGARELARLEGPGQRVTALGFGAADGLLAAGDAAGNLCLVEVSSGRRLASATATGAVHAVGWRQDELWCGEGNDVVVRDGATLAVRAVLSGHQGHVHDLSVAPDGARVASASHDGTVRLWHAARGDCLLVLTGSGDYVYSVAFSPTGDRLAAGCGNGSVYVWEGAPR